MTELTLLKQWLDLEQEESILEIRSSIASNSNEQKEQLQEALQAVRTKINEIKELLVNVPDKSQSSRSKAGAIRQVHLYIEQINKPPQGLRLDRDQGMILENYLFSIILQDFYHLVTREYYGNHIPAHLHYTYSKENSIDISELTTFFRNELSILQSLQDVNYVTLREYYYGLVKRISNTFINQ